MEEKEKEAPESKRPRIEPQSAIEFYRSHGGIISSSSQSQVIVEKFPIASWQQETKTSSQTLPYASGLGRLFSSIRYESTQLKKDMFPKSQFISPRQYRLIATVNIKQCTFKMAILEPTGLGKNMTPDQYRAT